MKGDTIAQNITYTLRPLHQEIDNGCVTLRVGFNIIWSVLYEHREYNTLQTMLKDRSLGVGRDISDQTDQRDETCLKEKHLEFPAKQLS